MFTLADYRFRYANKYCDISAYDLTSLKDFIKTIAFSIDKVDDDSNSSEKMIMMYLKQFTAD